LTDSGFQVIQIGNLRESYNLVKRAKQILYKKLSSKTYQKVRDPFFLKFYANQVEKRLASINCDVVFSPGTIPIAYLRTEKPIVFWTDATFAGTLDFYPSLFELCSETIRDGNRMEQLALSKCRLAIYASEWAANTAIRNYDVDPAKIKIVPFGANIDCNRDIGQIQRIIFGKTFEICKLLFIGVDWFRKGGDISIKVAELLNKRGIETELHIVGCTPPRDVPSFVKLYGFISKRTEEGQDLLDKLFKESHFLILPSRAECYGLVFAEASSFGLPSLATDVGGIPTAIQNGKNGQLFSLDDGPDKYCEYIYNSISSREEYEQLALSSFEEYTQRLNWTSAGKKVNDLIQDSCGFQCAPLDPIPLRY
jgi:glycosyltransferase involved in cell wall biosynthesis